MGNAVLCTADDGQPAAYMITDMAEGGNTLVCAAHWVDLCLSVAATAMAEAEAAPDAPRYPERAPDPELDPGPTAEAVPPPPDPGPPAGRSPTGPSGDEGAGEDDDGPGGFADDTVTRALADSMPNPDYRPAARSSPGKRPRRAGQPRNG